MILLIELYAWGDGNWQEMMATTDRISAVIHFDKVAVFTVPIEV